MHESRLVADIVARVNAIARQEGIDRVGTVRIELGPRSHLTPRTLEEMFAVLAAGTPAEGAAIVVSDVLHDRSDAPDGILLVSIASSS